MTSRALSAWQDAVAALGGDAGAPCDLDERYAEVHRRYHGTAHVEAVVALAAELAPLVGLDRRERAELALAACAHDVVYAAAPGEDERASAAWARETLGAAGVPEAHVLRVEQLVLTTLTHEAAPGDLAAAALLDADLSVLGADEATYDGYAAAVREEFAWVPDDGWRAGRADVLRSLDAHEPLFLTAPARERWEAAAHANLRRELASLSPASGT